MRRVFRLPDTRASIDRELEDEFAFHLEGRIDDLMRDRGLSREAAEREARRMFGDYQSYRRQAHAIDEHMRHRTNRMQLFDAIRRETGHAARALLRAPTFSIIAVVTLALGLGASTTIFTLLDRVVLRPLPYPNADRLVHLGTLWPRVKEGEEYGLSRGQYFYFKKNNRTLSDALFYDRDITVVPSDGAHPAERLNDAAVSANTFSLLGVKPELGRLFTSDAELSADPTVALISHGYWVRRFGANPNVVGQRLLIDGGTSVEIVGVLPEGARILDFTPDIWIPNHLDPSAPPINNHTHNAIGLLRPGATVASALADMKRMQQDMNVQYPNVYSPGFLQRSGFAITVSSLRDYVVGATIVRTLWLVFAAVAFVLLIAASNVANLFLVRIDARRREVAMRTALGADRAHLAIYYLAESVLLALVAAVLALAAAYALLHVVVVAAPQSLPRLDDVHFDVRSVAFCIGAALAFGVTLGLLPLASSKLDIAALREGSRSLVGSKARTVARTALVVIQVALAVVLLSGAGLMVRSFERLRHVSPGFVADGVHSMSVLLPPSYGDLEHGEAFWHQLIQRVEAIPGVTRAGASELVPLNGGAGCSSVWVDVTNSAGENDLCMPMALYTPGYFEALGIPLRGAAPTWSDVEGRQAPAVVTAAFAKRFWENADALGHDTKPYNRRMPSARIVAVSGDVRANGLQLPPVEAAFYPLLPSGTAKGWPNSEAMWLVVKAPSLGTGVLATDVRSILAQIEPNATIGDARPMELLVAQSTAQTTFTMMLLLLAAAIALALSAVGIYGVISYIVSQRRSEIGIRIALGARVIEVVRLVVGHSIKVTAIGAAVGLVIALASTRLLQSLLFDVSATDPTTLIATALVLLIVAAVASAAPARRAARIDPAEAMRSS